MKRILAITAALTLLLTACGADVPRDSEIPSAAASQTPAPETAALSEMPEPASTAPTELPTPENTGPTGTPVPESSAPTDTPGSVPTETYTPASSTPETDSPPEDDAPAETPVSANADPSETPSPAPAETNTPETSAPETDSPESAAPAQTPVPTNPIEEQESSTMTITINGQDFHTTLYDNETAAALKENLPLTLDMSELNGNEKYNYLPFRLPTNASNPGQIHAGDLMLYGSDCLVLFYKSFSTGYSYTPIGRIDDPSGLADAVGRGSVQVTFTIE